MDIVKCTNGHFYDCEAYNLCPHCGASKAANDIKAAKDEGKKSKHKWKSKKSDALHEVMDNEIFTNNSVAFDAVTEAVHNPEMTTMKKKGTATVGYFDTGAINPEFNDKIMDMSDIRNIQNEMMAGNSQPQTAPQQEYRQPQPEYIQPQAESPQSVSHTLSEVVEKISSSSDGRTMSYFSAMTGSNKETAAAVNPQPNVVNATNTQIRRKSTDPVVGWLICVEGVNIGQDFRICAGVNSVGRSESNRIVIEGDASISREKHMMITFEPKHCKFYIKPGDSSGLTYLNGDFISEMKDLNENDEIEIGASKFIFKSLCNTDFSWEKYL